MAIKNLPTKLAVITLGMFGFGFALVPLYDVFCDITGINGKGFERSEITELNPVPTAEVTENQPQSNARLVKVQFLASPQTGFSGDFYPDSATLKAELNKPVTTAYFARNASNQKVSLQAIPSISPSEASSYVTKMECFCFNQQSLDPQQTREMGLTFQVSEELPDHISTITFSYSLYPIESVSVEDSAQELDTNFAEGEKSDEPNT